MFKALFKKQMMEVNTWLIRDKKSGKIRSKKSMAGLILLYVILFGFVGGMFFAMAKMLCAPLISLKLGWLYFALMSLMAVVMGVFGSVFNTFATLYGAKDNELLLSMPVKPIYILTVRILGVYLWSFVYTALVFVPAIIVFMLSGGFSLSAFIGSVLMLIVISVFVLMLSCLLGYVVAKISTKLKNKSFVTVIASLAFIVVYYLVYFKAMEIIKEFLANAVAIGSEIKKNVLPIYWLGNAACGDFSALLIVALIVAALMTVTVYVMNRSFIKISTTNKGKNIKVYKSRKVNVKSVDFALLSKELRHFTSSANYMMNCSLGTLFLPILGIVALVKMNWVRAFISSAEIPHNILMLVLCAAFCSLASFNDITSPSVSLEGKNLWLAQSLPVSPWRVLKAKLRLHRLLTEIPVVFCSVCVGIAVGISPLHLVLCLALPILFVFFMAELGLLLNLKMPNLTWTNEIVPIKQSSSVFIALFGGWLIIGIFVGLYFGFGRHFVPEVFILVCIALLLVLSLAMYTWLKTRGAKIFERL